MYRTLVRYTEACQLKIRFSAPRSTARRCLAAQGREDISTGCAGVIAGWWFASKARRGHELIAAGLLMLAGHTDLDELDKWIRVGWERCRGATSEYGFDQT